MRKFSVVVGIECLQNRFGQQAPPMFTEVLPGDQALALLITSLTEGMAGNYYCSASYANTEQLEIAVKVETYGKRIVVEIIVFF